MIYGIGTDLVDIRRIEYILTKNEHGFINRVLTKQEQDKYHNRVNLSSKANYFAKRFAAKEAFAKALGTGIGRVVSWLDLSVNSNDNGKPYFIVGDKLRLYLNDLNIKKAHISLSDEKHYASAFVVLEQF